jgi:hypothetical protein
MSSRRTGRPSSQGPTAVSRSNEAEYLERAVSEAACPAGGFGDAVAKPTHRDRLSSLNIVLLPCGRATTPQTKLDLETAVAKADGSRPLMPRVACEMPMGGRARIGAAT